MALSADILRGYTDTIILHQLSHGDSYGYQINKTISTLSGGEVELKEATLYTATGAASRPPARPSSSNAGWRPPG